MESTDLKYAKPKQALNTILVAEDHDEMRNYICNSLRPHFNVLGVSDADQAIQMVVQCLPSLVIIEIMMPCMSGLSLCRHLKYDDRTCQIPVIMLTRHSQVETKLEGLNHVADDYLTKPFLEKDIHARVMHLINTRKKITEKNYLPFNSSPQEVNAQSLDEKFLNTVMNVMHLHMDDTQFSVEVFAREVGISPVQLYRQLIASTGFSPNDFIREQRMLRSFAGKKVWQHNPIGLQSRV